MSVWSVTHGLTSLGWLVLKLNWFMRLLVLRHEKILNHGNIEGSLDHLVPAPCFSGPEFIPSQ